MAKDVQVATDNAVEREALAWMDDPYTHFGSSVTAMQSLDRDHVEAVQLTGLNLRLADRRDKIRTLGKLADAQGIGTLASIDDVAPLMFRHDIYKSYPVSLLAKQRFDQLSTWLSRLTPYDCSGLDVSHCQSIDEWLTVIQDNTLLDVATSSGSSGTCSFFPKSKRDYMFFAMSLRPQMLQDFGTEPSHGDVHDKIHVLTPLHRDGHAASGRNGQYLKQVFGFGDEAYFHPCFDHKVSADLQWLAARLRAAAAKGDVSKVDVPPSLLARRAEWEAEQRDMPAQQTEFLLRKTRELQGQQVLSMGMTVMLYSVAKRGLEEGLHSTFGPGSRVMGGGGAKGVVLPPDHKDVICQFFGVDRMRAAYGMTELNTMIVNCEHDRYHMLPWVIPYLLDIEAGQPLPRKGRQQGRAAFFDLTQDGTWGGVVSGDLATIDWDTRCECGRVPVAVEMDIQRLSELQGGDDKITCAAQPAAHAEAMNFLTGLGG